MLLSRQQQEKKSHFKIHFQLNQTFFLFLSIFLCFHFKRLVHLKQLHVCTRRKNKPIKNAFSDSKFQTKIEIFRAAHLGKEVQSVSVSVSIWKGSQKLHLLPKIRMIEDLKWLPFSVFFLTKCKINGIRIFVSWQFKFLFLSILEQK